MWDMTRSHVGHGSFIWGMTHSYVGHDSFICGTWFIYMRYDSFICGTWLVHMWDTVYLYLWRQNLHLRLGQNSFVCGTWLDHMWDMVELYVWRQQLHLCLRQNSFICVTTAGLHMWIWTIDVTHMNESCHAYEWVMSCIWMSHVHIHVWRQQLHLCLGQNSALKEGCADFWRILLLSSADWAQLLIRRYDFCKVSFKYIELTSKKSVLSTQNQLLRFANLFPPLLVSQTRRHDISLTDQSLWDKTFTRHDFFGQSLCVYDSTPWHNSQTKICEASHLPAMTAMTFWSKSVCIWGGYD